ncbi:helix-turn-helix domain-containing protein [Massilia sp. PAMC28688]|uniref:helix-turn-helix domain-containing protein n=1 Tax=Massilia sp. PAMC28688 TaxID=2861283 RepID=UPI001C62C285|nr:helix-turn-helix domain-containing protein [Massilia sp. PAMC28688]QYF93272.1 helix-turn-helix domain-containing protein [Massilia sp. PAMC28688]
MTRRVLQPVAALAPWVRHIMAGGFESERVLLPACADVQLLMYLQGGAFVIDPACSETPLPRIFLVGPVQHPRQYRVAPGSRFVAVTFRPGGLQACLGMAASAVMGRIVTLDAGVLEEALTQSEEHAPAFLQQALLTRLHARGTPPPGLPALDLENVERPVPELAKELGIGVRQLERRFLDSLGMPLREYRRLARYSAAMTALMMQGASPQALASLAQDAGYVDQAHFTRDFSAMVGQPPGRFLRQRGDAQYALWQFTREELESYLS